MLHGSRIPAPAVHFCILLGAAGAFIFAVLGWIHAGNEHGLGSPQAHCVHRWIDTALATWAVSAALIAEWEQRRGARSQWFRVWLFLGVILVAIETRLGGMMVHGDDLSAADRFVQEITRLLLVG
jgi:hypothetical protein